MAETSPYFPRRRASRDGPQRFLCERSLCLRVVALLAFAPLRVDAHGDLHESIAMATQQIAANPGNAQLYLRRGELHRAHQDWTAAIADFDKAQELDPKLAVVELARGETLAQAGKTDEAKAALDRYLAQRPTDTAGFAARARLHAQVMEWRSATDDFARAIEHATEPEPALFIEYARALRGAGKLGDAIEALDAGMKRLGPLVTLNQPAIELEVEAGRIEAALTRLERIIAVAPRKERWLFRRGELLEKAGRLAAAREAYHSAQSELSKVPAPRRSTAAMNELAQMIDTALARLAATQ